MFKQQIALFIGMTLLIVLYFWGHNVGEQPAILANAMIAFVGLASDALTVSAIALISGGIGRRIGRITRLPLADLHRAEIVAVESGLGLGLISIGALLFGLVGLFNLVMWGVLLLAGLLVFSDLRGWSGDLRAIIASALRPQTGWERFILIVVGGLLFVALLFAFAPPFAWDGMTYHLPGPQQYVDAGRIETNPDNPYMGFPQNMDILFALAMALFRRATAATPVHFFAGFMALLATAGLIRRYTDRTTAYVGMLLLLSSYSVWWLFTIPYVDLGLMLYGGLALIAVSQWRDQQGVKWLVLAGIFAGLALGTKYTAGVLGLALGVFILVAHPRQIIRNAIIFGAAALITFVPWMIKGALLYQNPVYPYVLGGPGWDNLREQAFGQEGTQMLGSDLAWQWPILPVSVTIFGIEHVPPYSFTTGPWLLMAPLVLLLGWQRLPDQSRRLARDCTLLVLPLLIIWILLAGFTGLGTRARYMLVGGPAVAALGALSFYSLARWPKRPLNMDFIMRGALAFTTVLGAVNVAHDASSAGLGRYYVENRPDDYLKSTLGGYYVMIQHLQTLPEGAQVLFLWEPKGFYCPAHITCQADLVLDNWAWPLRLGTDSDSLMQQWQAEGVDYLLVWGLDEGSGFGYDLWLEAQDFARAENEQFPDALEKYTQLAWSDGFSYSLYTWKDTVTDS